MSIEIRSVGEVRIVLFPSQLDATVAAESRTAIRRLLESGHHRLVLDLDRVRFVDSAGLSLVVSALRGVRSVGGDIVLARVADEVRSILELTRLDQVFESYDDVDSAVASLAPRAALAADRDS